MKQISTWKSVFFMVYSKQNRRTMVLKLLPFDEIRQRFSNKNFEFLPISLSGKCLRQLLYSKRRTVQIYWMYVIISLETHHVTA